MLGGLVLTAISDDAVWVGVVDVPWSCRVRLCEVLHFSAVFENSYSAFLPYFVDMYRFFWVRFCSG